MKPVKKKCDFWPGYIGGIVAYLVLAIPYSKLFKGTCRSLDFLQGLICVFSHVFIIFALGFIIGYSISLLLKYFTRKESK